MFSIANGKLTETVDKHAVENDSTAASIAESNARFFNQLGSDLSSQAMDVIPRLTVDNGTLINVMLNKTVYLPPASPAAASQRYVRD